MAANGSSKHHDGTQILATPAQSRSPRSLREHIASGALIRAVGAHNPLGAKLAERAGFDAVWSSGLEISASQALPDADILTMNELLAVAQSMAASVSLPIIADCDAGYGNANNVMHMIRRYESAGVAAVCIEDKHFPKKNSFVPGNQSLVPMEEFCNKVAAAKFAQTEADLVVIARIEALVAGEDVDEALRRGAAYADAGADMVLIHARDRTPQSVLDFLTRWQLPQPVAVVPTTYHTITACELFEAGAQLVIYANHGLRAAISAITDAFQAILRDGRSTTIESQISPLSTVFELQGMGEFLEVERRFVGPHTAGGAAAR